MNYLKIEHLNKLAIKNGSLLDKLIRLIPVKYWYYEPIRIGALTCYNLFYWKGVSEVEKKCGRSIKQDYTL